MNKSEELKTITLKVTESEHKWLAELAEMTGGSIRKIARIAIEQYVIRRCGNSGGEHMRERGVL
jgi:hypothetical protein